MQGAREAGYVSAYPGTSTVDRIAPEIAARSDAVQFRVIQRSRVTPARTRYRGICVLTWTFILRKPGIQVVSRTPTYLLAGTHSSYQAKIHWHSSPL